MAPTETAHVKLFGLVASATESLDAAFSSFTIEPGQAKTLVQTPSKDSKSRNHHLHVALRLGTAGPYSHPLVVDHNTSQRLLEFTRHTQHVVPMVVDGATHSQLVGGSRGGTPYRYVTKGLLTCVSGIATPHGIQYLKLLFSDGFSTFFGSHGAARDDPAHFAFASFVFEQGERVCCTATPLARTCWWPSRRRVSMAFVLRRRMTARLSFGYVVGCDARSWSEVDAFSFVFLRPLRLFRYKHSISAEAATPNTTRRSTQGIPIKNATDAPINHSIETMTSTTRTCVHTMLASAISQVGQLDMQLIVAGGGGDSGGLRVCAKNLRLGTKHDQSTWVEYQHSKMKVVVPAQSQLANVTTTTTTYKVTVPLTKDVTAVCTTGETFAMKYSGHFTTEWTQVDEAYDMKGLASLRQAKD
ncbi:Aste57867_2569 [Aphanomyces stellatus]|uniref:Aste57867_2569 protein n=1 Tax=Aphanomyces stellatus TaxID=120398 RepID=A0A485KC37_9STRA|nr:hypothetical protein As57867_002562 [Aphanomyces stellatus]VFT79765.1 Aste57867_2569 [Aphanomyces stellatus]